MRLEPAAAGTQNVSQNIKGVSNAANQSGETVSDVLQSSDGLAAESRRQPDLDCASSCRL